MKTVRWTWVYRRFMAICPPLILAVFIALWGYFALRFYKNWFSGILFGAKLENNIPFGGDFSCFWTAAHLALSGTPSVVYDPIRLQAAIQALFGITVPLPWYYPPTFLMAVLPFALLPYRAALAVWLLTTLAGYLWVVRRIAPHPLAIALALIFSGTIQNISYGQNGFLSAALLGGGLICLDRAPVLGGILLGLLTYKPHLAVLVPVALIAGRRWQTLAAMAATAVGLAVASGLVLGHQVWFTFLAKNIPGVLKTIHTGDIVTGAALPWTKMPTIFSVLSSSGLGPVPAAALQALLMLGVTVLVYRIWRLNGPLAVRGSALVLGALLLPPYLFIYDFALLALPLAWIAWDGHVRGFSPLEKWLLLLAWLTPMLAENVAARINLPLIPLILLLLMFLVLRRSGRGEPAAGGPTGSSPGVLLPR